MKLSELKDLAILIAIGIGAYFVYTQYNKVKSGTDAVGSWIGGKLYDLFHPSQTGENLYYTVTFPNGERHAVASGLVNTSGMFVNVSDSPTYKGDGLRYQLMRSKDGTMIAVRA